MLAHGRENRLNVVAIKGARRLKLEIHVVVCVEPRAIQERRRAVGVERHAREDVARILHLRENEACLYLRVAIEPGETIERKLERIAAADENEVAILKRDDVWEDFAKRRDE